MKERSFDEMIACFNRRVSEMDIAQDYKMELLGMVTALGYKHEKTAQQWIPCSERLPKTKYDDGIPSEEKFIVTVKETWNNEDSQYHIDLACNLGDYIDNFWDTYNDWKEGQDVHVIAWMPLPDPYREDGEQNG